MNVESVHDLFVTELRRAYAVEKALLEELDTLADDADVDVLDDVRKLGVREELIELFEGHRQQTETHVDRLEMVFDAIDSEPDTRAIPTLEGLVEEKELFNNVVLTDEVRPLFYLGAAEQIEHLEIDAYRRLIDLAEHLDLPGAAQEPLKETLEEEQATLEALEELREGQAFDELVDALVAAETE